MKLVKLLFESTAADQAHQLGLHHVGWGYWADANGDVVAKTVQGKLVKVTDSDEFAKQGKDPDSDSTKYWDYENEPWKDDYQLYTTTSDPKNTAIIGAPPQPPLPKKLQSIPNVISFTEGVGDLPTELNGVPFKSWKDAPVPPKKKFLSPETKAEIDAWKGVPGTNPNLPEKPLSHSHKKTGAGIVIMEPDGRVWIVEPTNHFGGDQHNFPMGTLDGGLTVQESALRETFEESGLQVEIVDEVGDINFPDAVRRFFVGKRVGGNPLDRGWETHAVKLVPFEELHTFLGGGNYSYSPELLQKLEEKKDEYVQKVGGNAQQLHPKLAPPVTQPTATEQIAALSTPQTTPIVRKASDILEKHTGAATGTNHGGTYKLANGTTYSIAGGFYTGKDGVKRYVKPHQGQPEKSMGETLANVMYKEAGIAAPTSQYFKLAEGEYGFASDIVPNAKGSLQSLKQKTGGVIPYDVANKILDGVLMDVLLFNYDVLGLTHDNIMMVDDGSKYGAPVRIDNGGSFLSRATSGRKDNTWGEATLYEISDLTDFFTKRPQYKEVATAAGIKNAQELGFDRLKDQMIKIMALHKKYNGWEAFVETHAAELSPVDKQKFVKMLYIRTKKLLDFVKSQAPSTK